MVKPIHNEPQIEKEPSQFKTVSTIPVKLFIKKSLTIFLTDN